MTGKLHLQLTETHKDSARLKGDVISFPAQSRPREGELPEIRTRNRYSLAVAGTTLKVGGIKRLYPPTRLLLRSLALTGTA